ncbi:MAG: cupin domain-containing protein [Desulfobacterales bacterium]|jgi:quercetin dioxygenase-like cupin family protein
MAERLNKLTSCIKRLELPLELPPGVSWKPTPLFRGSAKGIWDLSCHASVLEVGKSPHPPHAHNEEEILIVLCGEVEAILPEKKHLDGSERQRLFPGRIVYYPADYPHTLQTVGEAPATYLMFKWKGREENEPKALSFGVYSLQENWPQNRKGFALSLLFEGPTRHLGKLHSHASSLAPGAGYKAHADQYNVAILVLEGEVETLGERVCPGSVIYYAAGEPHGMSNPGSVPARYVVFEFHSRCFGPLNKLRQILPRKLEKYTYLWRWRRKLKTIYNHVIR